MTDESERADRFGQLASIMEGKPPDARPGHPSTTLFGLKLLRLETDANLWKLTNPEDDEVVDIVDFDRFAQASAVADYIRKRARDEGALGEPEDDNQLSGGGFQ